MLAIATAAYAYQPVARGTPAAAQQLRHVAPIAQFRSPVGTDQAVVDQQKRAEAAGLSPKQYEEGHAPRGERLPRREWRARDAGRRRVAAAAR